MNRIIYLEENNQVAVIIPAQDVLDTVGLKSIAEKDVPQDLPYWFVNDTDIPSDRTDRNRWVLEDMSEPDGFGGVLNEFRDEDLMKLYNQGVIK